MPRHFANRRGFLDLSVLCRSTRFSHESRSPTQPAFFESTLKAWAAKSRGPKITRIEGTPRFRVADVRDWMGGAAMTGTIPPPPARLSARAARSARRRTLDPVSTGGAPPPPAQPNPFAQFAAPAQPNPFCAICDAAKPAQCHPRRQDLCSIRPLSGRGPGTRRTPPAPAVAQDVPASVLTDVDYGRALLANTIPQEIPRTGPAQPAPRSRASVGRSHSARKALGRGWPTSPAPPLHLHSRGEPRPDGR